jgi:hypothetical protein
MFEICIVDDCDNNASYGNIIDYKKIYCKEHKNIEDNLIDIRHKNNYCKSCLYTQGTFGYINDKKNLFCKNCKNDDMIDVIHKKCLFKNCDKHPIFNFEGETKPIYCSDHKESNMIDVINKKCLFEKCIKQPAFNFEGETNAIYCGDHKENNMIDVKHKRCLFTNCIKQPIYNFKGETNAIYCGDHKENNMIDVKHKRCLFTNCIKQPIYNFKGETNAIYCGDHKKPNMIDVKNKKCIFPLCDKFQYIDKYCSRCFYALFPNDNRCKRIKLKENEVKKFIQENFKNLSFIFDEPIKGDGLCINKRPDILLNLNKHSIIIEIDENQHKGYDVGCDDSRTLIIQEALNRPTIFIRFNPDDYIDENNKKILSPFKIDKKLGLTTIPEENLDEWNNRLLLLKETIKNNLEYKSEEPIRIIKLFYDN